MRLVVPSGQLLSVLALAFLAYSKLHVAHTLLADFLYLSIRFTSKVFQKSQKCIPGFGGCPSVGATTDATGFSAYPEEIRYSYGV